MSRPGGYDTIVIGAGVNGMVAAARLAKAGKRTILLERSDGMGGQTRLAQFAPGFRCDPLGQDAGWLSHAIARDLGLAGLESVVPDPTVAVPSGRREWLVLSSDMAVAEPAIRAYSATDAAKWRPFCSRLATLAGFLTTLYTVPPPDVAASGFSELLRLLGMARRFRALGREDMVELLRTVPMSVQELLDDWFECAPLKAAIAASGITDIRQGPRSGGTAFVLLHHHVGAAPGAIRGRPYWKSGPTALVDAVADAARRAGVEIRTEAEVASILIENDRATGVILAGGEQIAGSIVLSSCDPARTLLGLVEPQWLDPDFLLAVRNIKFRGSSAKVLYALDGPPDFAGLPDPARTLTGALSLTSSMDDLERAADAAKYGRVSERPYVEVQMPTARWPALAPAGKHVLVAHVQWAPYRLRGGAWHAGARGSLGDAVDTVIEDSAPGFCRLVRHREVLAPIDLEERYGLTEGAVTQGEMTLDQILFMRPVAGAGHYATPISGLYLCGAGTHPGSGIAGGSGWLAAQRALAGQGEDGR